MDDFGAGIFLVAILVLAFLVGFMFGVNDAAVDCENLGGFKFFKAVYECSGHGG